MSLIVIFYNLKSLKISYRFRKVAPPPFWLFLPPPQKRKKNILKISKKSLTGLERESESERWSEWVDKTKAFLAY